MRGGDLIDALRQIERPERPRVVAGVCSGLEYALRIDATLLRLAFILLGLAYGLGAALYVALWLVMPSAGGGGSLAGRDAFPRIRHELLGVGEHLRRAWGNAGLSNWPRPLGRRWVALLLIVLGVGVLLASLGFFAWVTPVRALGLALVAVGAGTLVAQRPK